MSEAFEPYAPPKANLARPTSPEPMLLTPEGLPRLRPLLRAALKVWRAEPGMIAVILLAVYLPLSVVHGVFFRETGEDFASLWRSLRWQLPLVFFVGLVGSLALARLVEDVRKGAAPSLRRCFRVAVARWLPAIWTQILLILGVLVGSVALILPGIFVAVATAYSIILVALRQSSGTAALQGSWDLVRGRWGPTFRLFALLFLCQLVSDAALTQLSDLLPKHDLILIAHTLVNHFVTAYFFTAVVILFLELEAQLKVTSEASDRLPLEVSQVVGAGAEP